MPKSEKLQKTFEESLKNLKRINEASKRDSMEKTFPEEKEARLDQEKKANEKEKTEKDLLNENTKKEQRLKEILPIIEKAIAKIEPILIQAIENIPIEKVLDSGDFRYYGLNYHSGESVWQQKHSLDDKLENITFSILEYHPSVSYPATEDSDGDYYPERIRQILSILLNVDNESIFFPETGEELNINSHECVKKIEEYILEEFRKQVMLDIQREKETLIEAKTFYEEQEEITRTRPKRLEEYKEILFKKDRHNHSLLNAFGLSKEIYMNWQERQDLEEFKKGGDYFPNFK